MLLFVLVCAEMVSEKPCAGRLISLFGEGDLPTAASHDCPPADATAPADTDPAPPASSEHSSHECEHCICCCAHIMLVAHFVSESADVPVTIEEIGSPWCPTGPPGVPYHPPRSV